MYHIVQSLRKVRQNETMCRAGKNGEPSVWASAFSMMYDSQWQEFPICLLRLQMHFQISESHRFTSTCEGGLIPVPVSEAMRSFSPACAKNRKSSLFIFLNRCRLLHHLCRFNRCKYLKNKTKTKPKDCLDALWVHKWTRWDTRKANWVWSAGFWQTAKCLWIFLYWCEN